MAQPARPRARLAGKPIRLSTGARLFFFLLLALFPLALIALVAGLQSNRSADAERAALMRVAATESARNIGLELVGDMALLRTAAASITTDPDRAQRCDRLTALFSAHLRQGARFGITDPDGRQICGEAIAPLLPPAGELRGGRVATRIVGERGLLLAVGAAGPGGDPTLAPPAIAKMYFPVALLSGIGTPASELPPYDVALMVRDQPLMLRPAIGAPLLSRVDTISLPLAIDGMAVRLRVNREPISAPQLVALITPLLMWLAAALIAWLVVDRQLLRPLGGLRMRMAAYRPGARFDAGSALAAAASELRDLAQVFSSVTRVVATHEAGLARGLEHQTKLTREVHHRVKNNLQVIASLINLHARGARGSEAQRAYASIQRRVDALAVVHRHHYAEVETNRGVPLRAVLGELTSSIRAGQSGFVIRFEAEPLFVNQDVAIALAFLTTELVEMAMLLAPTTPVTVRVAAEAEAGRAILEVSGAALRDSARLRRRLEGSVSRVIEGLSRQLRAPLAHDAESGAYQIAFPFIGRD